MKNNNNYGISKKKKICEAEEKKLSRKLIGLTSAKKYLPYFYFN